MTDLPEEIVVQQGWDDFCLGLSPEQNPHCSAKKSETVGLYQKAHLWDMGWQLCCERFGFIQRTYRPTRPQKLTDLDVLHLRATKRKMKNFDVYEAAKKRNVHIQTIYALLKGITYKHLDGIQHPIPVL